MRLVTWNVNSLKARLPRVLELLEQHAPDIVCLQETKSEPDAFPEAELREAGYQAVHHSAGRWAGVAVLARIGMTIEEAGRGLAGEPGPDEARWVEAQVNGMRVISTYVINGRAVDSPFFADKLRFLEVAADRVAELREMSESVALAGDFNVTRDDRDVYDPAAFRGATHVTEEERAALESILERGALTDAYRALHDDQHFTWWDYRQGHFHRGMGLRIDYVLLSESLAGSLSACHIERDFRKGAKPSDHAPLVADLVADAVTS